MELEIGLGQTVRGGDTPTLQALLMLPSFQCRGSHVPARYVRRMHLEEQLQTAVKVCKLPPLI